MRKPPYPWDVHGYPESEFNDALDYAIERRRAAGKNRDARRQANELVIAVSEGLPDTIERALEDARRPRADKEGMQ